MTFAAVVTSSVAWFTYGTKIAFTGGTEDINVSGGAEAFYYESGSGASIQDPYIISNKKHLYNLAWLQYMGYYNDSTINHGVGIQQKYFKIKDGVTTLDLEGLTLPPIGTDKYPFLGNFDGNGCVIKNFTISNDNPALDSSDFGVAKPANFGGGTQPEVVGFFGVVGKLPSQSITYNSSIISINNLTLKDFTVKSKTSTTLIGLAAGYVDGAMNGVKVDGDAEIDLGTTSKAAKTTITNNVTDYGLVGYSKQTGTAGSFGQQISQVFDSQDPNHGGSSGFGGELDLQSINSFIYSSYLKKSGDSGYNANIPLTNMTASTAMTKQFADYDLKFGTRYVTTRSNDTRFGYYMNPDGVYVGPYAGTPTGYTVNSAPTDRSSTYQLLDGCFIPLSTKDGDMGSVASNNNAYITGYTNSGYQGYVNLSSHARGGIGCSLNKSCNSNTVTAVQYDYDYNDSRVDILGYDASSKNFYIIDDGKISASSDRNTVLNSYTTKSVASFNYQMYSNARKNFGDIMTREENKRIHSISFSANSIQSKSTYTPSANGGKIRFNGQTLNSLEMPKGCIDFNLTTDGYINFLAANYNYQTRSNYRFFSLYHIERNQNNAITSIKKIHKIYKNNTANPSTKYIYQYNNDSGSYSSDETAGATLLFDVTSALETNRSLTGVLFYFEIPVIEGEYAIAMAEGANTSSLMGARLIYLDIGINGGDAEQNQITAYTVTTDSAGLKYPVGVDFKVVGTDSVQAGGVSFCLQMESNVSGSTKFTVASSNVGISAGHSGSTVPSKYSYQGTRYSSSNSPPSGTFNVTGGPGEIIASSTSSIRTSHISVYTSSGRKEVLVIDVLSGSNISSTTYVLNGTEYASNDSGSPATPAIPQAISSVAPLLTKDIVMTVRALEEAITLTRANNGSTSTFDVVLPTQPWTNSDAYNVSIDPYPSGLSINILRADTKYYLNINTDVVFDANSGSTLSAVYPAS